MAATGMKMKQAGLVKKPMYVVPNHMLEQFAREFMQLYPNARLLVATKEDLAKRPPQAADRQDRQRRVGRHHRHPLQLRADRHVAGLPGAVPARADRGIRPVARATAPATARGSRNIIKTIEKQKARREERLKDLLAEDKKDDGLVFDELGVDHIFIDEAHYFKNLETPTKMERVAGIQTGGSERAFDLYMKARYLGEQHPGHGVTFATGTPISNTMVELYTMQRFLDPEGLQEPRHRAFRRLGRHLRRGGRHHGNLPRRRRRSSPAAASPASSTCPSCSRCSGPSPTCRRPRCSTCPGRSWKAASRSSSPARCRRSRPRLQQELVARYDRLRSQKVDPREDNALAITTDGRKLALDARLLSATAEDFPGSKINALVDNVAAIWQKTAATRGTQMIFCDMGVNPTPWGYCVYDEIIDKLAARGIPREQIAAIGDADSDAKKQALFERVRSGAVRVLIGSTQKMGTGTNVQKRLVALHHLDAPWKPAEVEQREGRILRQGNEQRGSGDLPLRHRRIVRRLYVAGPGNQGPVHRAR